MKRSEMILAIASELVSECHEINWARAQLAAGVILNRIETEGMLPPAVFTGTSEDMIQAYIPRWESEDG
jgi:hypothetical protein